MLKNTHACMQCHTHRPCCCPALPCSSERSCLHHRTRTHYHSPSLLPALVLQSCQCAIPCNGCCSQLLCKLTTQQGLQLQQAGLTELRLQVRGGLQHQAGAPAAATTLAGCGRTKQARELLRIALGAGAAAAARDARNSSGGGHADGVLGIGVRGQAK